MFKLGFTVSVSYNLLAELEYMKDKSHVLPNFSLIMDK